MLSAKAVSWLPPALPTDGSMPAGVKRSLWWMKTYRLPLSL
jgi:hypothetical protein